MDASKISMDALKLFPKHWKTKSRQTENLKYVSIDLSKWDIIISNTYEKNAIRGQEFSTPLSLTTAVITKNIRFTI